MKISDARLEAETPEKKGPEVEFATSMDTSITALGWILKQMMKASMLGIIAIFSIFLINSTWNYDARSNNFVRRPPSIMDKEKDTAGRSLNYVLIVGPRADAYR